ncbi:MAG TPA: hypothetical protein VIP70_01285 [Nitrososphaeraceae archaeon]
MIQTESTAKFSYSGLSLAETEIIYNLLKESFYVHEENQELLDIDNNIVSTISIEFPFPYSEQFFDAVSYEWWFNLKNVIKEMKKRRGKRGIKVQFLFNGILLKAKIVECHLIFQLMTIQQKEFERAIEKIEYIIDIIAIHVSELPASTTELYYTYDSKMRKWIPHYAKAYNNKVYFFTDNRWK